RAVVTLIDALKNSDSVVRRNAAALLGASNDRRARPSLVEALGDSVESVGLAAATALASLDTGSVSLLRKALLSDNFRTRAHAADAVGALGRTGNALRPQLLRCLRDEYTTVRQASALALVNLGYSKRDLIQPLTEALKSTRPDVRHRAAAILD